MPNWKTHLEISRRLNEKYKFNDKDYELFLIGSILPDINNSYVVTDISKKIGHSVTHLYTDYTWNNNFYTSVSKRNFIEKDKEKLRILKQSDFKIYNNKFVDRHIELKNNLYEEVLERIKVISEIDIIRKDLENVCEFLKENHKYIAKYQFYTEQELDELLDKTIIGLLK